MPLSPIEELTLSKETNSHDGRDTLFIPGTPSTPGTPGADGRYYYVPHDSYPSQLSPYSASSSRFSVHSDSQNNTLHSSTSHSPLNPSKNEVDEEGRYEYHAEMPVERSAPSRTRLAYACLVVIGVAVICGAYFGTGHYIGNRDNSAPPSASTPGTPATAGIVYGGYGTVVTTEQGSTFTYNNSFGGYFVVEQGNPFNNNARAQSWSPPLNQSWQFGRDQILG